MARPFTSPGHQIQSAAPAPPAPASTLVPTPSAKTTFKLSWGWQAALFVWLASFGFLLLNDLLTVLFKIVSRLF